MAAYIFAQLDIQDDSWVAEYIPAVHAMVEAAGGKYLVQTPDVEHLEGDSAAPSITVLIEFPSVAAARTFYQSAEYQPQLKVRLAGSSGNMWLMEGV